MLGKQILCVISNMFILSTISCFSDDNLPYMIMEGDVMLVGAFPVHQAGMLGEECAEINTEDGLELMLSMFHVINQINQQNFLPFTIGAVGMDTCANPSYTLRQCVSFLTYHVLKRANNTLHPNLAMVNYTKIAGFLGAYNSHVTVRMASLLQLFDIPQISFSSTSPILSDSTRYKYFMRTVPSDKFQVQAIAEILEYFNWKYVSVLYENTQYGHDGVELIDEMFANRNLCMAIRYRVRLDRSANYYKRVINGLTTKNAKVVILYMNSETVRFLFNATDQLGFHNKFIWIGTDGWSGRQFPVDNLETVATRSLTIQPISGKVQGFKEYFHFLVEKIGNFGWMQEFLNRIDSTQPFHLTDHIGHVSDAVYAYAFGLEKYYNEYCTNINDCDIDLTKLHSFIQNVNFTGVSGLPFSFQNGVDPIPRYKLMRYVQHGENFRWTQIGRYYSDSTPPLEFFQDEDLDMYEQEESICSKPCNDSQATIRTETCCFRCVPCGENQYLVSESECKDCPEQMIPLPNRSRCEYPTPETINWTSSFILAAVCFTCICVLATIITIIILIIHHDTPTVKACGRESSAVLLFGILLLYTNTFFFVSEPGFTTCSFTRVLLGLGYTVSYAAILTKTNRIARIFDPDRRGDKIAYVKPLSQIIIILLLIFAEICILAVWIFIQVPKIEKVTSSRTTLYLVCAGAMDYSYLIALVYPLVLLILSSFYAFKTRKAPIGFNEARLLVFTNYTNLIIWIVFVPAFFANDSPLIRMFTLSMATTMSGFVTLVCFFVTRAYVVMAKPEKNTKEAVMQPCSSASSTGATKYNRQMSVTSSHLNEAISISSDLDKESSYSLNQRRISIIEPTPDLIVTRI